MSDDVDDPLCELCDMPFAPARAALGYVICTHCGEQAAIDARKHWTIAPLHKSNYQLITDPKLLTGINNKGGLVK